MGVLSLTGGARQPAPPRDRALIVTGDLVEEVVVLGLTPEYISTPAGDFPREQVKELVRPEGGRMVLVHTSLPARVEADHVRKLRRNALLHSLFSDPGPDANRIPWQIWGLILGLIIALVILGAR